jgi:hypothetical protein
MKIDKKYATVLTAFLMSVAMAFFISLILTYINIGLPPDFLQKWLKGFGVGFLVGLPVALVIFPIVKKVVQKLTSQH